MFDLGGREVELSGPSSPPVMINDEDNVLPPPNNTMSKRGTGRQQAFTPPTGPIPPGPSGTTDSNNNPLALGGNVDQHDNRRLAKKSIS